MSHRIGQVALLCALVAILIGVGGAWKFWSGASPTQVRLNPEDCKSLIIWGPYRTWELRIDRDGSASLYPGLGIDPSSVGFGDPDYGNGKGPLPKGSFDFDQLCRDVLNRRMAKPDGGIQVQKAYKDMPTRVLFRSTDEWLQSFDPTVRDGAEWTHLDGILPPGEGQRLIEDAHAKATAIGTWPPEWDKLWPYPPVPWGDASHGDAPPPEGLRIQSHLKFHEFWKATVHQRDGTVTAPTIDVITDPAAWEQSWSVWGDRKPLPNVNFQKDFVLLFIAPRPAEARMPRMSLRASGTLDLGSGRPWMMTLPGSDDSCLYVAGTLPRDKIKTINGRTLPEAKLPTAD